MSSETKVILAKGGTAEREVLAKDIKINDLWHCAMALKDGKGGNWNKKVQKEIGEEILEVWYLAHFLKQHIIEKG